MNDAWAVISPEGGLAWYPLAATANVEALVSGDYAPGALDRAFVTGPIRVMASDIALLVPERYPPNLAAQYVITFLSGDRVDDLGLAVHGDDGAQQAPVSACAPALPIAGVVLTGQAQPPLSRHRLASCTSLRVTGGTRCAS